MPTSFNPDLQDLFWYYVAERSAIREKRKSGVPPPWTRDLTLRVGRFTNVFPHQDRVTEIAHQTTGLPKGGARQEGIALATLTAFRFFNVPEVYAALTGSNRALTKPIDVEAWTAILTDRQAGGAQLFTGAYINTAAFNSQSNFARMVRNLRLIQSDAEFLMRKFKEEGTVYGAVRLLSKYDLIGPFIANMIIQDLLYLSWLDPQDFSDYQTWVWPGPGAVRGLNRLLGRDLKYGIRSWPKTREHCQLMLTLQSTKPKTVKLKMTLQGMEHSLCEFDKYVRVTREGKRPWRRFRGGNR